MTGAKVQDSVHTLRILSFFSTVLAYFLDGRFGSAKFFYARSITHSWFHAGCPRPPFPFSSLSLSLSSGPPSLFPYRVESVLAFLAPGSLVFFSFFSLSPYRKYGVASILGTVRSRDNYV